VVVVLGAVDVLPGAPEYLLVVRVGFTWSIRLAVSFPFGSSLETMFLDYHRRLMALRPCYLPCVQVPDPAYNKFSGPEAKTNAYTPLLHQPQSKYPSLLTYRNAQMMKIHTFLNPTYKSLQ